MEGSPPLDWSESRLLWWRFRKGFASGSMAGQLQSNDQALDLVSESSAAFATP
jgi:hypothetical protein